jgi:hypothetical protein
MSRVNGAIMQPGTAFGLGANAPMVDLTYGGQMGWAPDHAAFVNNQAHVRRHLIPILIQAPKLFQYFPNGDKFVKVLRALIETQWLSIDGLNRGLTAEFAQNAFGGSGQMQRDLVNIKRAESMPKHSYIERYGRPIQRLIETWMLYAGMDPDTKFASVATLPSFQAAFAGGASPDLLADQTTMTVLYIEPDAFGRKVQQAFLCFNMFPEGTGDIVGSADKTQDMQTVTVDLSFTALQQVGAGVDAFAQRILNAVNYVGANPMMKQAMVDKISADVASAIETGFDASIKAVSQRQTNF